MVFLHARVYDSSGGHYVIVTLIARPGATAGIPAVARTSYRAPMLYAQHSYT